jgi:hypothetical protein
VQQFELDLEVLAHAAASLQDLRVISGGKQVPYVLERTALTRSFLPQMTADDDPKQPKTSRWKITLPQHPLPVGKLTFAVPGAYFKRQVTLSEEVPDPRGNLCPRTLASGTWLRRPEQKESTLSLQLASPPLSAVLMLEIQNGDNPPLDLREPAAWYPVTRVLLVAPLEAQLHLYYGNPKAHAPQYDLELAVPRMLAAQKHSATPGPEELLKPAGGGISAGTAGWQFWAVLGIVVVVLLLVIAKLLPKPREKQP